MNDDGTRRDYSPEETATADRLIALSESTSWAIVGTYLATEFPNFVLTPDMEEFIRMGILAGQIGTIETVREMGFHL